MRLTRWMTVVLAAVALMFASCGSDATSETSTEAPEDEGALVDAATTDDGPAEPEALGPAPLTEPPTETDFFEITIGDQVLDGSGLVFNRDGELSLRGLFGEQMDHLQLDLTSSGFGEQTPTVFGPAVSRVIGQDAAEDRYSIVDDPRNRLSINERGPALTVWGDFAFLAVDSSTGEEMTVSGVFDIPIGSGDWDCDWDGQPPACGFIS